MLHIETSLNSKFFELIANEMNNFNKGYIKFLVGVTVSERKESIRKWTQKDEKK